MKRLNLIGQRFGYLTVIEEAPSIINKSGKKYSAWKCQCDCGKITIVRTDYLRNGHTKSCGCLAGRVDITGKKFGRLLVLLYAGNSSYLCKCDCGKEVIIKTSHLKNGNTQSCGCLQKDRASEASFKSLVGQKFGKLTVIKRVENNRYKQVCYLCKCDCGGEAIVSASNLKNGNTNSCGCIKSKGEMKIQQYLQQNNIKYCSQYSFDDIVLSSGRRPFYDFVILDKNKNIKCVIEYQGIQHYTYDNNGWNNEENFEQTKRRDKEKKKGLIKKQIPLYEIPYWELNNIEDILGNIIKETASAPDLEEAEDLK